jgi:GntR family transcriptional regulator, transcriptional repressor for pyruvate dehydrogenase complex
VSGQSTKFVQRLEEQILRGEFQVGDKLPSERDLAERFGLSRPAVREALRSLEERRLIRIEPGRGSFVDPGTSLDVGRSLDVVYRRQKVTARQLVEARIMVESEAAGRAAERATPDDLEVMGTTLARLEDAQSRVDIVRLDLGFHLTIIRAAHNPVIEAMFGSIASLAVEQMVKSVSDSTIRHKSHPFHRRAFEAISRRDVDAARRAMVDHLRVADETYGADYDRHIDVTANRALQDVLGLDVSLSSLVEDILNDVGPMLGERTTIGGG